MVYAEILAGGMGTRMGNPVLPKQFMEIGNKPIIIHTLEQFVTHDKVDQIVVCCPKDWMEYMDDLVKEHLKDAPVKVVEGGTTRYESLMNGCKYIENEYGLKDDDIIITHDSVRPFLTQRMISDNIEALKECDAVNTVVPAIDTIIESKDGFEISSIPNRSHMYQGQSPQSFYLKELINLYESLNEEEKSTLTDACKIYSLKNKKIKLVNGEAYNFKITNSHDIQIANAILPQFEENNKPWLKT